MEMKKLILAVSLVASTFSASAATPIKLSLTAWIGYAPFYVAETMGYYTKQDLTSSLNSRGLGFPACGKGVIDPTSANPKPRPSSASGTSPSLSKPAAMPSGLGKAIPATWVPSGPCGEANLPTGPSLSASRASPCARSASIRNSSGRISGKIMAQAYGKQRLVCRYCHTAINCMNCISKNDSNCHEKR